MKAMQERARRGVCLVLHIPLPHNGCLSLEQLLSEDEKVILASLEAQRARGASKGDKDCLIM